MKLEKRELLFRGQAKYSKKWFYGCPLLGEDHVTGGEFSAIATIVKNIPIAGSLNIEPVEAATVTQYIGFKDCKGKKIFEGDILELNGKFLERVIFVKGKFCFRWRGIHISICEYYSDRWEIVGNIFENAELLKKDD